ncbi:hypothetical protein [Microbispora sp. H10949]|uniref:hypothetical protein n=1 Tax=Microbispora sp. H10949 TaxID=2729111 RepID=UPI001600D83B|nr:hypothetical protein [Microbispora sp. H10949]
MNAAPAAVGPRTLVGTFTKRPDRVQAAAFLDDHDTYPVPDLAFASVLAGLRAGGSL